MLTLLLLLQGVANSDLGYRMTLPDDFVPFLMADVLIPLVGGDIVGCWAGEGSQASRGALILCVRRLHRELEHQRLKQADLPPAARLISVKWNDLDIDASRADSMLAGNPAVIYAAWVPLRREAIQVVVVGRRDRSEEAQAILTQVLGSLKGESNWSRPAGRSGPFGTSVGWLIGIAIGLILVRIILTRRNARAA